MSADQITPERIGEIRELADYEYEQGSSPRLSRVLSIRYSTPSNHPARGPAPDRAGRAIQDRSRARKPGRGRSSSSHTFSFCARKSPSARGGPPPAAVPERAAWLTIEEMANALVLDFGTPIGAARGFARAIAEASKAKGARLPAAVQGWRCRRNRLPEEWWNMVLERGIGADNSSHARPRDGDEGRNCMAPLPPLPLPSLRRGRWSRPIRGSLVSFRSPRGAPVRPSVRGQRIRQVRRWGALLDPGTGWALGSSRTLGSPRLRRFLQVVGSGVPGRGCIPGRPQQKAKSELAILLSKALAAGGEG